jgi:hypothetical protein
MFAMPSRFVEVKMSNWANETFGLRPLLAENVCDAFAFRWISKSQTTPTKPLPCA